MTLFVLMKVMKYSLTCKPKTWYMNVPTPKVLRLKTSASSRKRESRHLSIMITQICLLRIAEIIIEMSQRMASITIFSRASLIAIAPAMQ